MSKKDEEKAMDIGDKWEHSHDSYVAENAALEMAEWKDKQFSDRVIRTLCTDCYEFGSCDNCPKYKLKKELLAL